MDEKWEKEKINFIGVWLESMGEGKISGVRQSCPPKCFLSKIETKLKEKHYIKKKTKNPCVTCTWICNFLLWTFFSL